MTIYSNALHRRLGFKILVVAAAILPLTAQAVTLNFDEQTEFVHGRVINSQYVGVSISAINDNTASGSDYAVLYNSTPGKKKNGGPSDKLNDRDTDLTGGGTKSWSGGNAAAGNPQLGNLLIIQENREFVKNNGSIRDQSEGCDTGVCRFVDDEELTPAGSLIFDFDNAIESFGMDVVDIHESSVTDANSSYSAKFYDASENELGSIGFGAFVSRDNAVFGNNTLNTISPINFLADLGIAEAVTRVIIFMGGSGGLDNITYENLIAQVPEPGTIPLFAAALLLLAYYRRRYPSAL